jgi:predicted dehydrogenase
MIRRVNASRMILLYDFLELFDPMTQRIVEFLSGARNLRIESIRLARSKDREDPANPRNYKKMVPIQYQETVHCLAYVVHLLAQLAGSTESVFEGGVSLEATSEPYQPPNPGDYPYVVDGRCDFSLNAGGVEVKGITNFKRGAPWTKMKTIRGTRDGRPFTVEAEYLEDHKYWRLDGEPQVYDPKTSSYEEVLKTLSRWCGERSRCDLLGGIYPNPRFAHITYQLSSALWKCSHSKTRLRFSSLGDLLSWDAGFAAAAVDLERYS